VEFFSNEEGGDWEEGEGWLSSLIPLREDIAGGDYRALYLGWLSGAQSEEPDEEAVEPPCPPGLSTVSAPLRAFADFLRIDNDWIEVAAAASPALTESSLGDEFERWVATLNDEEKTALLVNAVKPGDSHVRAQLLRRFRAATASAGHSGFIPRPRTVREIRSLAESHGEERRRKEAARNAADRALRERGAAAAREDYLNGLAQQEVETWAKVDSFIGTKRPRDYDQAAQLLKDLSDLGLRSGRSAEVQARISRLRRQHANKLSFLRRLDNALKPLS
jgi:hypothetical protein